MKRTASTLAIGVITMGTAFGVAGCGGAGGGPGTESDSQVCATVISIDQSEPTVGKKPSNANRIKAANELHDFAVRIKAVAAKSSSSKLHGQIIALATDLAEESVLVQHENTTGITALQTRLAGDAKSLENSCPGLSGG